MPPKPRAVQRVKSRKIVYKFYGNRPIPRQTIFYQKQRAALKQAKENQNDVLGHPTIPIPLLAEGTCDVPGHPVSTLVETVDLPENGDQLPTGVNCHSASDQLCNTPPLPEDTVSSDLAPAFSSDDESTQVKKTKRRRKRIERTHVEELELSSGSDIVCSSDSDLCELPLDGSDYDEESSVSPSGSAPSLPHEKPLHPSEPSQVCHEFECLKTDNFESKSPLLCPCGCTDATVDDVYVRVLTLGMRHNWTWKSQIGTLKIINSLFKNEPVPSTHYYYTKRLGTAAEGDITTYIFCPKCDIVLGPKEAKQNEKICTQCSATVDVKDVKNFFVSISIEAQLKKFFADPKFVKNIRSHRFKPRDGDSISDVYDGKVYKKLVAEGLLSDPNNISFTFFTDGVAHGNGQNKSIWPIYLVINELPYEERFNYVILAGVRVGSSHPQSFFEPFVQQVNKLSSEGMLWRDNTHTVLTKVFPLCCVADSGARYKLLNFQMHSAKFGCTFCYKETVKVDKHTSYRVSRMMEVHPPLRTESSLLEDLQVVCERTEQPDLYSELDVPFRGVKGVSALYSLNHFNLTTGFGVDFMHAVCLGVVKDYVLIMLNKSFGKYLWEGVAEERIGMSHLINTLDKRINHIQGSTAAIRKLRGLSYQGDWKAREYLLWILFYCIPCVSGLMKKKYVLHLSLLSSALYTLLLGTSREKDLDEAQRQLQIFTYYYQIYFKEKRMVYNMHLLSAHLVDSVKNFGPLVMHSAFAFEGENQVILNLAKSHFSVSLQIARKFLTYQNLPKLCSQLFLNPSTAEFIENTLEHSRLAKCVRGNYNVVFLGKPLRHISVKNKCVSLPDDSLQHVLYYSRVIYHSKLYCTVDYCENSSMNNSLVRLVTGQYAIILNILRMQNADVLTEVQIVKVKCEPVLRSNYVKIKHLSLFESLEEIVCVSLDCIEEPCFILNTGHETFLSRIPYGCTVE